jgi:hypothetical protein
MPTCQTCGGPHFTMHHDNKVVQPTESKGATAPPHRMTEKDSADAARERTHSQENEEYLNGKTVYSQSYQEPPPAPRAPSHLTALPDLAPSHLTALPDPSAFSVQPNGRNENEPVAQQLLRFQHQMLNNFLDRADRIEAVAQKSKVNAVSELDSLMTNLSIQSGTVTEEYKNVSLESPSIFTEECNVNRQSANAEYKSEYIENGAVGILPVFDQKVLCVVKHWSTPFSKLFHRLQEDIAENEVVIDELMKHKDMKISELQLLSTAESFWDFAPHIREKGLPQPFYENETSKPRTVESDSHRSGHAGIPSIWV